MDDQLLPPVLEADQIEKAFYKPTKVPILKSISLKVFSGDVIAIMGRSGEGKSTLLHILGTLEPPCGGLLKIANKNVSSSNTNAIRNRHIGFIFQSFHLLEDYTVLDNVLMPARIARLPVHKGSEAYLRAIDLLELVGLSHRIHFSSKLLSGGEKQRASIARALCNEPDIILADEPSGNLDHRNSEAIHELLLNLAAKEKKTVVVVTHNNDLANVCQKRYTLQDGVLFPS